MISEPALREKHLINTFDKRGGCRDVRKFLLSEDVDLEQVAVDVCIDYGRLCEIANDNCPAIDVEKVALSAWCWEQVHFIF